MSNILYECVHFCLAQMLSVGFLFLLKGINMYGNIMMHTVAVFEISDVGSERLFNRNANI